MAVDQHAVAAFYDDATYSFRPWNMGDELQTTKFVVSLMVFHVQNAGNLPNVTTVTGHDMYCTRKVGNGFVARQVDTAPGTKESREHFFEEAGNRGQTIGKLLPSSPDGAAVGGMTMSLYSMDFAASGYTNLQDRAVTKALELRSLTAPLDGTY